MADLPCPSTPVTPLPAADTKRLSTGSSVGSGSESDGGGGGGRRAQYKQRRARARERKINSGRALRLAAAENAVCVDVALEKVTRKRQPRVMSDEEVERLLSMSRPPTSGAPLRDA
jgi:hypothetical protein